MLKNHRFFKTALSLAVLALNVTLGVNAQSTNLKTFSCDSTSSLITKSGVSVDKKDSSDGKGSLKLQSSGATPSVFRLYEVSDLNLENTRVFYKAKVKARDVKGKAYLEMWVRSPGKGEFFSRGLDRPIVGTTGWTSEEIPFFLKQGEKADQVKLNLVIEGGGTIWIDDIQLAKAPL